MNSQTSVKDFALLSDGNTAALVHRSGSIDWYCPARYDAPAAFARLLDEDAGYWQIQPLHILEIHRQYLTDSMVLQTVFNTASGRVALTDALALEMGARGHEIGRRSPHILLRMLECLEGEVEITFMLCPRPEYGLGIPLITEQDSRVIIEAGSLELILSSTLSSAISFKVETGAIAAIFKLKQGEQVEFALHYRVHRDEETVLPEVDVAAEIRNTQAAWQSWAAMHHRYNGLYVDKVRHSAMVLQGLTYLPTGTIIAASTTSLPEEVGGSKNWDYRYAWLRDLTFTMRALWITSCDDEVERYFHWIARAIGDVSNLEQPIQIMYGVEGERDLTERVLSHLDGFLNSRPVRVGNAAWNQQQLDVLGEVVDAVYLFRNKLNELGTPIQQLVIQLANRAAISWQEPDAGMWEARDKERHYLSSKVMCWVALDRAIKLAPSLGSGFDLQKWKSARDDIHAAVLQQGWNEHLQAFTGAFGSDHLDASVLLMPLVDFLPATDPRMYATIKTIERELSRNGQVYRWKDERHTFLLCTFWLVECLALANEWERAQQLFEETAAYANDLGLLAEMNDVETGELIGNFPQTFSHIGLINAAWRLSEVSRMNGNKLTENRMTEKGRTR